MAKTGAERQKEWRARQKEQDLVRVELMVKRQHVEQVKAYVQKLNKKP